MVDKKTIPIWYSWVATKIRDKSYLDCKTNERHILVGKANIVLGMSYRLPKHIKRRVLAELVDYGLLKYHNNQVLVYCGDDNYGD